MEQRVLLPEPRSLIVVEWRTFLRFGSITWQALLIRESWHLSRGVQSRQPKQREFRHSSTSNETKSHSATDLHSRALVKMSAEDDPSQSGYEDGPAGGPGAPTPLSALDVSYFRRPVCCNGIDNMIRAWPVLQSETSNCS